MKKTIIIIAMVISLIGCNNENIIILDGYAHGVAVCVGGGLFNMDKGIVLTVNEGHYEDKELKPLMQLASEKCHK